MSIKELDEKSAHCQICGSSSIKAFEAHAYDAAPTDNVKIRECMNCHFAWQFPRGRTASESAGWFEKSYDNKHHAKSDYFDENRKREISQLEMGFVTSLNSKGQSLLDIGAGSGIFADVAAENGWNVTAVDPAINEDKFKNSGSIKAIKGSVDNVPKGELFDVVTLWDVIEHVESPIELIITANQYLKKGGWLIIETGNYKSTDRISEGVSHWIYQLDHRWYFSPGSIEKLLLECGFDNIRLSGKVLRPGWNGTDSYAGPSLSHLIKSIVRNPLKIVNQVSKHRMLVKAKSWKHAGIGIFAIASRKV